MLIEFIVLASTYCDHRIANGKRMDCTKLTAASRDLVRGTCISIHEKIIKINDVGPCSTRHCQLNTPHIFKRKLDLSTGAAKAIGFSGLGKLKYKIVKCQ